MSGYVDLHNHVVPGVDDGARTLDDSLMMVRALQSVGFDTLAPSPHNRSDYPSRDGALVVTQLELLRIELRRLNIEVQLHPNAENFFLDEHLFTAGRTIGTGTHLLVEAPYTTVLPALREMVFQLQLKGITPLIAHPERCIEFEKKGRAAEMVQAGAKLQLDIGALIGRYGPVAKKLAKSFLDEDLYEVAASDVHSPVGADKWLAESIAALDKAVGAAGVQRLLSLNPRALLTC